jgi:deoxyribodipyrimidine photo-lyase
LLSTPDLRIVPGNTRPPRKDGDYVLYWMTAFRRASRNFALDRALEWAAKLQKPLVVLEALRAGHPWASDRLHRFVIDGMRANERAFAGSGAHYHPYVEPAPGAGRGLLEALAKRACVVVTDDFPCFFLPRMTRAAAAKLDVLLESVDSNGLLPLRATDQVFPTAYSFRRFLQKNLRPHLLQFPSARPFDDGDVPIASGLPRAIEKRWPRASAQLLAGDAQALAALPIDHSVPIVAREGGSESAERELVDFVRRRLPRYAELRSEPESDAASGLSPWIHFGHLSVHGIFAEVARAEGWSMSSLGTTTAGKRAGFWGVGESAESFLDELVTWRELGFNCASKRDDYDQFASLPAWAQSTLEEHANDPRPRLYTPERLERAATHDALWNAAQTELVRDGKIHNYLRMLWGKKILEWTASPREALAVMIHLNNKYALDGRDPNSYSGIFWVLGRYDRPWGPTRKIFGTIRYMSSENTARKFDVDAYVRRWSQPLAESR